MTEAPSNPPLNSWKEIASYLGRDMRTAQRWEKERGLPVHHVAGKRGPVYAYTAEIDSWLTRSNLGDAGAVSNRGGIQPDREFPPPTVAAVQAPGTTTGSFGRVWGFLPRDHFWHVISSCLVYAALFAVSLLIELTYDLDRLSSIALRAGLGIFVWILAAALLALALDYRLTRVGNRAALAAALSVFILSAASGYVVLRPFLPDSSSVVAGFQTFTVQAAYLKDTCYFLILACIFWVPPFHFVASLEREIGAGKRSECLALVCGDKHAQQPVGAVYPKPGILLGLWLAVVVLGIFMLFHLFDNLKPSPHKNLFMQLVLLRTILYFAFGTECLVWYSRAREELKRSCQVANQ